MISELFASMSLVRHNVNAQTHDSCDNHNLGPIRLNSMSAAHGLFVRINVSGQIVKELL